MKKTILLILLGCCLVITLNAATASCNTPSPGWCCCGFNAADLSKPGPNVQMCKEATCAGGASEIMYASQCIANTYLIPYGTLGTATWEYCEKCPIGYFSAANTKVECTECAQDQFSTAAGAGCGGPISGVPSANLANCQVFKAANAVACSLAQTGYTVTTSGSIVPCAQNCDRCSDTTPASSPTPETCTKAATGYIISGFSPNKKIEPCIGGCWSCAWDSFGQACSVAQAGWFINQYQRSELCAKGFGSADKNTLTACTDPCDSTKNCATCTTTGFCSSCQGGYVLNAAAGTCTKYTGTPDYTCLTAQGSLPSDCMTCNSASNFRSLYVASTASPVNVGVCNCLPGYGSVPANSVCKSCGPGGIRCTFDSNSVITQIECENLSKYQNVANLYCVERNGGSSPPGFFYHSGTGGYSKCYSNCAACTDEKSTKCLSCFDKKVGEYTEPSSTDPKYPVSLAGLKRAFINGTCYDECPSGYATNAARDGCELQSVETSSNTNQAAGKNAFGVFSVLTLLVLLISASI